MQPGRAFASALCGSRGFLRKYEQLAGFVGGLAKWEYLPSAPNRARTSVVAVEPNGPIGNCKPGLFARANGHLAPLRTTVSSETASLATGTSRSRPASSKSNHQTFVPAATTRRSRRPRPGMHVNASGSALVAPVTSAGVETRSFFDWDPGAPEGPVNVGSAILVKFLHAPSGLPVVISLVAVVRGFLRTLNTVSATGNDQPVVG
jgi:hypothetical protein